MINTAGIEGVDADPDVLERMTGDLVAVLPVERIYVFGSRARGDAKEDSDIDVYVVTSADGLSDFEQMRKARLALRWMVPWKSFSKDVLCATEEEYEARKSDLSQIEHVIAREGKVVYAK